MLLANLQHFCCNNNIIILNYYYFIPGLFPSHSFGGQKAAVSDLAKGWGAADNLGASRVSIRMDNWTDRQRTDDGTHGFRGGFISHPNVLY